MAKNKTKKNNPSNRILVERTPSDQARASGRVNAKQESKRVMSTEERQKSKKMEKALIVATILVFLVLLSKSLFFDGMAVRNHPDYAAYYQKIEGGFEFPFAQKLISFREEDGKWKAKVRKYFLYILPVGDAYIELPPLEEWKR